MNIEKKIIDERKKQMNIEKKIIDERKKQMNIEKKIIDEVKRFNEEQNGENDNTKDAWIALYCSSCNNWKVRKPRKVRKGSKIVRTTMAKPHKNATPDTK